MKLVFTIVRQRRFAPMVVTSCGRAPAAAGAHSRQQQQQLHPHAQLDGEHGEPGVDEVAGHRVVQRHGAEEVHVGAKEAQVARHELLGAALGDLCVRERKGGRNKRTEVGVRCVEVMSRASGRTGVRSRGKVVFTGSNTIHRCT